VSEIYNLYQAIKTHEKLCRGFHITGKIIQGVVSGVCSRCGFLIEQPRSAPVIKDDMPGRIAGWEGKYVESDN
jgi:hypothetical protein